MLATVLVAMLSCACAQDIKQHQPIMYRRSATEAPPPSLPKSCSRDNHVVTCPRNVTGDDVMTVVRADPGVDIIVLHVASLERQPCACDVINMTRRLDGTGATVVSEVRCSLGDVIKCGFGVNVASPIQAGGLVTSQDEAGMTWAMKHHILTTWYMVQGMRSQLTRDRLYSGILQELREVDTGLLGGLPLDGGMLEAGSEGGSVAAYVDDTKVGQDGRHDVTKATIAKFMVQKETSKENLVDDDLLHPPSETELWNELESEITDIKKIYNHIKRRQVAQGESRTGPSKHRYKRKYHRSQPDNKLRRLKTKVLSKRESATKSPALYFVPKTVYIGGDFHSMYDKLALESVAEQGEAVRRLEEKIHRSESKTAAASAAFAPFAAAAVVALPPGLARRIEEDGHRSDIDPKAKLDNNDDDGVDDEDGDDDDDARTEPDDSIFDELDAIQDTSADSAKVAIKPPKKLSEDTAYDHRVKSFIVFFVGIVGIIVVMAVLMILAMKDRRPTKNPLYPVYNKHQGKKWRQKYLENERRRDEQRAVFDMYPGVQDDDQAMFDFNKFVEARSNKKSRPAVPLKGNLRYPTPGLVSPHSRPPVTGNDVSPAAGNVQGEPLDQEGKKQDHGPTDTKNKAPGRHVVMNMGQEE